VKGALSIATAYVGLGSNLNDREDNIRRALRRLNGHDHVQVVKMSSLYETEPVGVVDQPSFLNAVARLSTELEPAALLEVLKSVERSLGRRKTFRWGPRKIDLDLLLYDDVIVNRPHLIVPHPELARRAFVLVPLAEIAPGAVEPRSGRRVDQLLRALESHDGVRPYSFRGHRCHD
jgi:2-amino-4-hydroxy-6-hydroxymethyldihydropteridine diphosphokinase